EAPANKPANIKAEFAELVKMVVWFLVLFFALKILVIEGYEVQGPSMEPTLQNNERILVFKLPHMVSKMFPSYQPIKPGDIFVFERTEDAGKRYVKRVIAEGPARQNGKVDAQGREETGPPPVKINIEQNKVYVNNQRIEETYLSSEAEDGFDSYER